MKKYFIITLTILLSTAYLKAQESESDSSKTVQVATPSIEQAPNSSSGQITISGPDGVIIQKPATNYSMKREKYSIAKDESLRNEQKIKNDPESMSDTDYEIIYSHPKEEKDFNPYEDESRKKSDVKTLAGSGNHDGGFGAISFRYSEFRDEPMVLAGFRAGWIENRILGIGFEGHGVIPISRYGDIDAYRDMILVGGYGGMFLELILFSNQAVHVTFPVSAGGGWLGYTGHWDDNTPSMQESSNRLADHDTFWYIEPGANLEFNVSRNFRMCFGISKRYTRDFVLINTAPNSFEKPNYYLTLKFGRF